METLIIGVSDYHDGLSGRTVVGVTVRRSGRRWTLGKFLETLFKEVSDHHDDRAGRTVVKTMVRHKRRWGGC